MQGNVGENNNASEQDKRPTSHIGGDDKKTHSTAILSGTRAEEHGKEDHNSRHAPESTSLEVQEVDEFGLPAKKFNRPPSVESSASSREFDSAEESLPAGPGVATKDSVRNTPTETKVETDANPHRSLDGPARNGEISVEREVNSTAESKTVDDDEKRDHEESAASHDAQPEPVNPPYPSEPRQEAKDTTKPQRSEAEKLAIPEENHDDLPPTYASEWSHQQIVPQTKDKKTTEEDSWQEMPAFAPFDLYNDDGKLIAREAEESDDEAKTYAGLGGAGKGYTKVNLDEDAQSATSMDENTKYLFKDPAAEEGGENEDEEGRDALAQLQATKDLLTEQQRIAYVGLARVAMVGMIQEFYDIETTRGTKKDFRVAIEALKMWSQKTMVRLYAHMDISPAEQLMIEQLPEHGVEPGDLTPTLMQNARVKNPNAKQESPQATPRPDSVVSDIDSRRPSVSSPTSEAHRDSPSPPALEETEGGQLPEVRIPSQLESTKQIDIDLRWTVLCDLFLVLISDSIYDARSRVLLERVGSYLGVPWLDICTFEKRVTEALEMQEAADKENWNEDEHMENRRKLQIKRRMLMMGIATVGGGLVIGLSAGLLAPVIGAGLAAGFTTVGVAGTSGFLAGAGGAAVITSTGVVTGGAIAVRASSRRMGSVKTFEYRPLHNNKRVNLIVTVSGWMNGKVDDVRLPYSTVDPIMGDVYSILWEPEMLQSMGQTINILATEALTQGLQQILGSTVLVALMASLQLPIVLTKLSYLIDNPWTVSLDRANSAGLILADSLIDRNLGVRPVTLVGFSLGSRVIFSCLRELAKRGAFGLVQNVYMFGAPVVAKKDDYLRIRSIVSGRMVNGYAKNDWILGEQDSTKRPKRDAG
ncbi:MAG: hypothetical protein M1825_002912 [Sarcosagium campestre]|nr:MAG: hypothetical protein M1825_002912 [Sarcosagium campestre]